MKKLFLCLLVAALFLSQFALADVDLSGMTFDELVALKDQINLAIWNSEEWQEVTVPQGRWIVGEDIPTGKWTVKCADVNRDDYDMSITHIYWGNEIDDQNRVKYNGLLHAEWIYNPDNRNYESGEVTEIVFDFADGMIVDIDSEYAPALFTPYSGKQSLGFK